MTKKIGWRFPPLSGGTRQGYTDNGIEVFKGEDLINNLAREICQNSLDAHDEEIKQPVKVTFELRDFQKNKYKVFTEYDNCIKGCRKYWENDMDARLARFLSCAESMLSQERIPVLVASDYNTNGLTGNHSCAVKSSWEALTASDGVSVKDARNSAGAFGIGKNAPFACSALSMVFYNTLDRDNDRAFVGVARLATLLNENGKTTQRVGKYQINDDQNESWLPIYPEDECSFRDAFMREKQGTDIIIAGFNQEDWTSTISKAILKNFFVAICEGRLVVEIKEATTVVINADSIENLFTELSKESDMVSAYQLFEAFSNPEAKKKISVLEDGDVDIYVKANNNYRRTIANFRATGMLVGTYSRRIFQHYAAVVVVRGMELGTLLKDTEPTRHNKWDYKLIDESEKGRRKKAKKAINVIDEHVLSLLKEQFEVVTSKSVDAVGVGDYLPDNSGIEGLSDGTDILRPKIKISKINVRNNLTGSVTSTGIVTEGKAQQGDVHNGRKNDDVTAPSTHPVPVIPGQGRVRGATSGCGSKTLRVPNVSAQRAFPINVAQGLYKIVIVPKEKNESLYMKCLALGEDGRSDVLSMQKVVYNNRMLNISNNIAGPFNTEANVPAVLFASFANKEKMILAIQLMEGNII